MFTVITIFCKYGYYSEHYGGFSLGKNNPRYHLKKKEEKQTERQGEGTLVAHMK